MSYLIIKPIILSEDCGKALYTIAYSISIATRRLSIGFPLPYLWFVDSHRTILKLLRQHFGEPVIISSGYRCPTLNILVGEVYASQHTLGEAADIVPLPPAGSPHTINHTPYTSKEWFDWLQANTDFDQLILEHDSKGSYWIHVSCRKNKSKNRHQVIRNLVKK